MRVDRRAASQPLAPTLAIVAPTFKEAANIRPFLAKLEAALGGEPYEVIFVDDNSPDGTADLVREIARTSPKVRCVQRIGPARSRLRLHRGDHVHRPRPLWR